MKKGKSSVLVGVRLPVTMIAALDRAAARRAASAGLESATKRLRAVVIRTALAGFLATEAKP